MEQRYLIIFILIKYMHFQNVSFRPGFQNYRLQSKFWSRENIKKNIYSFFFYIYLRSPRNSQSKIESRKRKKMTQIMETCKEFSVQKSHEKAYKISQIKFINYSETCIELRYKSKKSYNFHSNYKNF